MSCICVRSIRPNPDFHLGTAAGGCTTAGLLNLGRPVGGHLRTGMSESDLWALQASEPREALPHGPDQLIQLDV